MSSSGVSRIDGVDPFVAFKAPVKVAATGSITLSGSQTVDGVLVSETTPKTRVLAPFQADTAERGIYDVYDTAWVRSDDFNGSRDVVDGTLISVTDGAAYGNTTWKVNAVNPVIIGTTALSFEIILNFNNAGQPIITTWESIAAVAPTAEGQLFTLAQHTSGGIGGGTLMAFVGSVTDDGGTQKNALGGFYLKRINYELVMVDFFGALGDGVTDDWAAFDKCRAAGFIGYLRAGKTYFMSTGHNIGAKLGFVCADGKATILMSRAGFSDATYSALTQARCCFVWTSVDGPICKNIKFQLQAGAGIRTAIALAVRGCTNLDIANLEATGFNESRGGIFTVDSCIGGIMTAGYVHDCTANTNTLPTMQLTGLEVDNNRIANVYSEDIYFGSWNFTNITLGATALALYGFQTDGVTLSAGASATSAGVYFESIYSDNVYEALDIQSSDNYIGVVTAKNSVYGVKIVHAAKRNFIDFIDIDTTYSYGLVISGSITASEPATDNIINRVVARNIGVLGGALQKTAVGFDGGSATYLPSNNMVRSVHCDISGSQNYLCYSEAGTNNTVDNITYTGTPVTELFGIVSPARANFVLLNRTDITSGYTNNRYYGGGCINPASTTALALVANTLYAIPFEVKKLTRFTELSFVVTTLAAGNARVGIYTWVDGKVGNLLYDAGTISVSSTGAKTVSFAAAQWLQKGWYALAIVSDVAPQIYSSGANIQGMEAAGVASIGTSDVQISRAFAYAALPASFGAATYTNANLPNLLMRAT